MSVIINTLPVSEIRLDGGTQPRVEMDLAVVAEYAAAFEAGASFPPVVVYDDGEHLWLADGFHRVAGAKRAGIESIPAEVRKGTRREAVLYSCGANAAHGLRRTNEDKRRAVTTLLQDAEWARWSDREIARACGVHHTTVSTVRAELTGDLASDTRTYRDKHGNESTMDTSRIGRREDKPDTEAQDTPEEREEFFYSDCDEEADESESVAPIPPQQSFAYQPPEPVREPARTTAPHVSYNSGNNEWYTPESYIEAARAVMGGIDLDPASSAKANEIVKAKRFHTAEDDGLSKSWKGRVWMNPPYASDLIGRFVEKLASSVESGDVSEAIVLVNNATDTQWFARLSANAACVCFPTGRVRFWSPTRETCAPLQGQAVVYIGNNSGPFIEKFREFGRCWRADG